MSAAPANEHRHPPAEVLSVSEVTGRVKESLETRFSDVWISGEVTNLVRAGSGHIYLSLKDDSALLRGVVWRGSVPLLAIEPADGMEVVCHGRLEVYAPRGTYQLTIDRLHSVGTGALEARLRQLHQQLDREGLFAPARKRPLPVYPRRIAVVTSPTGAAIADFLQTVQARWRSCEVIVVPSRVQGAGASAELAAAIQRAGRIRPPVDAIALIRGGGSLEDLWAFNEEAVVRAVAAAPIPVVSGVGHEIDISLCDLAADQRALTPTDAAVRLVPDSVQLAAAVAALGSRLRTGLVRRTSQARQGLQRCATARILSDPLCLLRDRQNRLTTLAARLTRTTTMLLDRSQERLRAAVGRLEAGSPLHLLARGYSVTWLAPATPEASEEELTAGPALRSAAEASPGGTLITQLATGRIWSRIERISSS